MGATENLALHVEWSDAENRHDLSRHHEFLHDDIQVHVPGAEPYQGFEAYLRMMEELYAGMEGFQAIVEDRFATDDRVACRWRAVGRHTGDLNGIPATGKDLEYAGMSFWEFDDGKARRGWVYPDVAALMTQLMG
jgi:steroid delta-isomerase-like uncharacterized protein